MKPKLEEGEVICSKCEGRGCSQFISRQEAQVTCSKCFGEGKLDWISNDMGEREIPRIELTDYNHLQYFWEEYQHQWPDVKTSEPVIEHLEQNINHKGG